MRGLRRCTQAFSGCDEQGLLSSQGAQASCGGGFPHHRARALELRLSSWGYMGSGAPQHVESSQIRDRTCVLCNGPRILNHWTSSRVLIVTFFFNWNILLYLFLIKGQLFYSIVLVSTKHQHESAIGLPIKLSCILFHIR